MFVDHLNGTSMIDKETSSTSAREANINGGSMRRYLMKVKNQFGWLSSRKTA